MAGAEESNLGSAAKQNIAIIFLLISFIRDLLKQTYVERNNDKVIAVADVSRAQHKIWRLHR
jgi:hypothetical protein